MNFKIKNRRNGNVLFSVETESFKLAVEAAIKSKTYLKDANLQDANLQDANLQDANLQDANLQDANLQDANLQDADLQGANLRDVKGLNKYISTNLYILLDQPGMIRAYKLVNRNNEGPFNGGIVYKVGNEYTDEDANTDETVLCGRGINLATLDWCINAYRKGRRILIAEFKATDIASIPIGSDGKFRVKRCRIVGEKDLKEIGLIKEEVE